MFVRRVPMALALVPFLLAVPELAAQDYLDHQVEFLQEAADEEAGEGDRRAEKAFLELARTALRQGGAASIDDLPGNWVRGLRRDRVSASQHDLLLTLEEWHGSFSSRDRERFPAPLALAQVCLFHARHELSEDDGSQDDTELYLGCAEDHLGRVDEALGTRMPEPEPMPEPVHVEVPRPATQPVRTVVVHDDDMPPNPEPNKCYARVWTPPVWDTITEEVVVDEGGERVEIVPAKYQTVTEQVLVKDATYRLETVPARYETQTSQILIEPPRYEWQRGPCDPRKEVAGATGECFCWVEIPARYKDVKRRVMVESASTRRVEIPAEFKTITREVEVEPAHEIVVAIPPKFETITRKVMVSDGQVRWQEIDCKRR
ncbi:MAG: hypothetical protein AAF533_12400 [Acidobacteriota bacterium]